MHHFKSLLVEAAIVCAVFSLILIVTKGEPSGADVLTAFLLSGGAVVATEVWRYGR
jgi:hypothetical protein